MKINEPIYYTTPNGVVVAATVRRVHRDGTATVTARFAVNHRNPSEPGSYLGYNYRIKQTRLRKEAKEP